MRSSPNDTNTTLVLYDKQGLLREFEYAYERLTTDELRAWGIKSFQQTGIITLRRGKSLGSAVLRLCKFIIGESRSLTSAALDGQALEHLEKRSKDLSETVQDAGTEFIQLISVIGAELIKNPKKVGPKLFGGVVGFFVGSGGIDGDGGIPDMDLLAGIGAHRSIFTHSVIPGIIVEASVYSTIELARLLYAHLPEKHDPFWDSLIEGGTDFFDSLSKGVSAGLIYHLGVDATVDGGGSYSDLPVSLPIEGHQAVAMANAGIEAADLANRIKKGTAWHFDAFKEAALFAVTQKSFGILRSPTGKGYDVVVTI